MKIVNHILKPQPDTTVFEKHFGAASYDLLFFDIETTGLSARNSMCYLIGCVFYEDDVFILRQYFAELPEDEALIIAAFLELIKDYKYLIHFNGNSFDIPFIKERARLYKLSEASGVLDTSTSIDLLKTAKSISGILKLKNHKQKTIEQFLHINRTDKLSGAQLIKLYQDYLKDYLVYQKTNEARLAKAINEKRELILLHNYDDVAALPEITQLFSYLNLSECNFTLNSFIINNESCIEFSLNLNDQVPTPITLENDTFKLRVAKNNLTLIISIFKGELKHFYPNHKDYYYIPSEDTAIHKSVAFYIDKNHRKQATAANCYIRKSGLFLPHYEKSEMPVFKTDLKAKETFFELNDSFTNSREKLLLYAVSFIKNNI